MLSLSEIREGRPAGRSRTVPGKVTPFQCLMLSFRMDTWHWLGPPCLCPEEGVIYAEAPFHTCFSRGWAHDDIPAQQAGIHRERGPSGLALPCSRGVALPAGGIPAWVGGLGCQSVVWSCSFCGMCSYCWGKNWHQYQKPFVFFPFPVSRSYM